jgi:hypothetical protein
MLNAGKAVMAGLFARNGDLAGLFILRAASAEEARAWIDADPAVKAGLMVSELHPWWSEDIFKKAVMPLKMSLVYFGFLKKGPNRKEGDDSAPDVKRCKRRISITSSSWPKQKSW